MVFDLFNKKALGSAQRNYKRALAKCESYRVELEDVYAAREMSHSTLVNTLFSANRQNEELLRRLAACDEARKNLGEKLRKAQAQIETLQERLDYKTEQYSQLIEHMHDAYNSQLSKQDIGKEES